MAEAKHCSCHTKALSSPVGNRHNHKRNTDIGGTSQPRAGTKPHVAQAPWNSPAAVMQPLSQGESVSSCLSKVSPPHPQGLSHLMQCVLRVVMLSSLSRGCSMVAWAAGGSSSALTVLTQAVGEGSEGLLTPPPPPPPQAGEAFSCCWHRLVHRMFTRDSACCPA